MKKGKVSLFIGLLFVVLGISLVTIGVLSGMGILPSWLGSINGFITSTLSVSNGGYGTAEFGAFLLLEALIVLVCRLRRPFSMFSTVLLVPIYLTLQSAFRVYSALSLPSFVPEKVKETHPGLLFVLFILELLLLLVILFSVSNLDARWRKKREIQIKMLEKEGAIKSKETLQEEKLLKRQQRLNEKEERERQKDELKYNEELNKKEKSEQKRKEKEALKEKKEYEKKREKEEIRREKERQKEEKKALKKKDKTIEKEENRKDKEDEKREKEERLKQKEEKRNLKEAEKEKKKNPVVDFGEAPEYDEGLKNPDTPLSFPQFCSMPELKTIGHHEEDNKTNYLENDSDDSALVESSSFMDNLKTEMDKEEKKSQKDKKKLLSTKKFKGGGMLEATLEMYNNSQDDATPLPPQRPIIGLDSDEEEIESKPNQSSSFAPSNLSPEHPRYKMFKNLTTNKGESNDGAVNMEENEGDLSVAPSNLSPDHPRYKMFENLKNGKYEEEKVEEKDESDAEIAPSYLKKDHPRYKLFESLKPKDESMSSVSYTPLRAFKPEDESVVENPYEKSSSLKDKGSLKSAFKKEEKNESVRETVVPEEKEESDFVIPTAPRARRQEVSDDGHKTIETKSVEEASDDFNLVVGVGDLASNRGGYTAIALRQKATYTPPSPSLLKDYPQVSQEIDSLTRQKGEIIVQTLAEQRISVELSDIIKGPTVTMYELRLAQGMIISKIKAREDELNYALGGKKVRILAPVPGKQAVGIEVPNDRTSIVGFKDMVYALRANEKYKAMKIPMILGKTITGEPIVIDVSKMPHMIIAGTTGSGKSVCINSFINTIIYQKGPKDVRLIMVDPKVVELTIYNGIPHLLTPVITDAKRALKALNWLVCEMERRYSMLARYGVRNVIGLNEKIEKGELRSVEKLPYIVLIMDEFADIMAVLGKEMDNAISRIAAKARAAGIHMILATQRPSADVILGTLKSNLPGRIAFAVSSGINSRVILDEQGAENLLGKGDMLLLDPADPGLKRIQGAFVSDSEVEDVAAFASENNPRAEFLEESVFEEEEGSDDDYDGGGDIDDSDGDLYEAAKKIVYERKSASASYLQRRLKIGYNRAARIVEMMEEEGIVGPANGSKPREVLKYE